MPLGAAVRLEAILVPPATRPAKAGADRKESDLAGVRAVRAGPESEFLAVRPAERSGVPCALLGQMRVADVAEPL